MRGRARRTWRVTAIAVPVAAALTAAGCGSDAAVKTTDDGRITVTGKGAKARVTIESDTSELTFNQQRLPKAFPRVVPRPSDWKLIGATSGTSMGHALFQVTYSIGRRSPATEIRSYQTQLTEAGFVLAPGSDGSSATGGVIDLNTTGNGWRVSAASVTGRPPHTVVISVQPS